MTEQLCASRREADRATRAGFEPLVARMHLLGPAYHGRPSAIVEPSATARQLTKPIEMSQRSACGERGGQGHGRLWARTHLKARLSVYGPLDDVHDGAKFGGPGGIHVVLTDLQVREVCDSGLLSVSDNLSSRSLHYRAPRPGRATD
jgi:hypothetical protein